MPKVVDADARRQEIIEAVWRIVVREGVEAASLRRVADEAGLAIGSVRHYFDSHEKLLVAAAQAMVDRISARLEHHVAGTAHTTDRRSLATDVLEELLPLDRRRRDETGVWFAFVSAARTKAALAAQARELHHGTRSLARAILRRTPLGDDDTEVEHLCAVIDGLAMNGVLQPRLLPSATIRRVLAHHLDGVQERATRLRHDSVPPDRMIEVEPDG